MGDDLRIANYDAIPTRQYRRVNKIVMHGRYNPETQQNDIALITVETPFLITNTFSPVNITDVAPVDNEPCRVGMKLKNRKSLVTVCCLTFVYFASSST